MTPPASVFPKTQGRWGLVGSTPVGLDWTFSQVKDSTGKLWSVGQVRMARAVTLFGQTVERITQYASISPGNGAPSSYYESFYYMVPTSQKTLGAPGNIIGFTPILRAKWIECEECDATAGLSGTPRLHKGTWFARNDLGAPLYWGLGQDTTDTSSLDSPGNNPDIVSGSTGDIQNSDNGVLQYASGNTVNPSSVTSVQSTTPGGGVSPSNVSSTSDNSSTATPTPSGGGGGSTPDTSSPTDWTPWLIGGAVVAGAGVVGYAYWKKHKGRR